MDPELRPRGEVRRSVAQGRELPLWREQGGGQVGLLTTNSGGGPVHDPLRRRLIAVAKIEGPAHLLQNSDEQDRRVTAYGQLVAGLCQSNRIARAQMLERTLPNPGDELTAWARQRKVDPATPAGAIYTDLLQQAAPAAARHETLFSFAINLDAVSREVRKHGGGITGATAVLESEARASRLRWRPRGLRGGGSMPRSLR